MNPEQTINVYCDGCRHIVRIRTTYAQSVPPDTRCPRCGYRFQVAREPHKRADGLIVFVPPFHDRTDSADVDMASVHEPEAPDFVPGGGAYGGAGASEGWSDKSSATESPAESPSPAADVPDSPASTDS